jgi:large subunit ribosomal protein L23
MSEPRDILKRPLITEKGTGLRGVSNSYQFEVARDANKLQIKQAVEKLFNVKVVAVRTAMQHGKVKKLGRFSGRRPDWKKATVTLAKGATIELFEQM